MDMHPGDHREDLLLLMLISAAVNSGYLPLTHVSCHANAPHEHVYRALVNARAVATWMASERTIIEIKEPSLFKRNGSFYQPHAEAEYLNNFPPAIHSMPVDACRRDILSVLPVPQIHIRS